MRKRTTPIAPALAGHKVRRINEDGEEVFSAKEVFPEGNPAMLLRGYQFNVIVTKDLVFQKPYAAGR